MKEKKNIDRLYQEKFKDFESTPKEKVWKNIAASLDKKEKNRPLIIPLWFKIGGVAAVLAIILASLLFTNTQNPVSNETPIVQEENENKKDATTNSSHTNAESDIAEEGKKGVKANDYDSEDESFAGNSKNTQIANSSTDKSDQEQKSLKNKEEKSGENETRIASSFAENITGIKEREKSKDFNEALIPGVSRDASGLIAINKNENQDSIAENLDKSITEQEKAMVDLQKKELKDKEDSEEEKPEESKIRKFRIGTFAAPVYYTNLGSGNEISTQFNSNSSSSQVNLAYGVNIAYVISEKLKIRTGISKLNMSYSIKDVAFSPTAIAEQIENISPNEDNVIIRNNSPTEAFALPTNNGDNNSLSTAIFTPGEINQQFGFIEVPLEIEYTLIDSKFALNLIGGASSLFLDENSIDLISGNTTTNLGKASNINNTSFSTNVGLGIHYRLTDKFSLNLEPIFKYQLNTFNNVENVNPLNIGVYSGLSIQF